MLPADNTKLQWHLEATMPNGKSYTKEGNIPDAQSAYRYDLSFNFIPTDYADGGGTVKVSVNANPIREITDEVQIYQRLSSAAKTSI